MSDTILGPSKGAVSKIGFETRQLFREISPLHKPGHHILVACFPKSGSTYLSNLLSEVLGYSKQGFVNAYKHNEQDMAENVIRRHKFTNTISQHHMKGTQRNVALLEKYNVQTIVLTRNIYDVIISIHDHITNEDHRSPLGYIHQEYFSMTKHEQFMFIIRIMGPWYFSFLMSWHESIHSGFAAIQISYQELFGDQLKSLHGILGHFGQDVEDTEITSAIDIVKNRRSRLNVGKAGRGSALTQAHKDAILDIAKVWKVDPKIMSSIGISL